jgi:hypothetical protein
MNIMQKGEMVRLAYSMILRSGKLSQWWCSLKTEQIISNPSEKPINAPIFENRLPPLNMNNTKITKRANDSYPVNWKNKLKRMAKRVRDREMFV